MSITKKVYVAAIFIMLGVLALADAALFGYVNVVKHSMNTSAAFRENASKGVTPPPRGYSITGGRLVFPGIPAKGWVVRYASPKCEYCRADESNWSALKSQLITKGYRIYEIPPSVSEAYADKSAELAGEAQVAFVDVDWMKNFRFTGTPTTILFNGVGRVIWTHVGVMNRDDQRAALRADILNR